MIQTGDGFHFIQCKSLTSDRDLPGPIGSDFHYLCACTSSCCFSHLSAPATLASLSWGLCMFCSIRLELSTLGVLVFSLIFQDQDVTSIRLSPGALSTTALCISAPGTLNPFLLYLSLHADHTLTYSVVYLCNQTLLLYLNVSSVKLETVVCFVQSSIPRP